MKGNESKRSETPPVLIPQPRAVTYRQGEFALQKRLQVQLSGGRELERKAAVQALLGEFFLVAGYELPTEVFVSSDRRVYSLQVFPIKAAVITPKPGGRLRASGYELRVRPKSIEVVARDVAGLLYGVMTLRQLAAGGKRVPCATVRDWPELSLRGIHFDLKGVMPRFDALMSALVEMSRFKLNCVLLEYEDKFPWSEETGLASPRALSARQLRRFLEEARARHIRVIPLVQALGHAEMVLQHRQYAPLREVPDGYYQYCPTHRGSAGLVTQLIDEVAAYHPDEPFFHVGADEAWLLGTCPRCARAAKKLGKNGLYLRHMRAIWDHVFSLGKRPIMWDDMLRHFRARELRQVPRDVALMYWLYHRYEPDAATNFPQLPGYLDKGFTVLGASAAKGADGSFANLPHFERRLRNVFAWAEVARRHRLPGVVSTAWSRYTYLLPPCEPFDTIWLSLAGSAEAYWGGRPPTPEAFVSRFLRFAGGDDPELGSLLLRPERPLARRSAKRLRARAAFGGPWAEYWQLLASLAELEAWLGARESVEALVAHQVSSLESGRLPRSRRRQLRERVRRVLRSAKEIRRRLGRQLARPRRPGVH